jgi:hypothetical protein
MISEWIPSTGQEQVNNKNGNEKNLIIIEINTPAEYQGII